MLTEKQQAMELYPIGTQLVMKRLSQAALCAEIFGEKDIETHFPEYEHQDKKEWMPWFESEKRKWRITVTAENQAALSPVPMVGDTVKCRWGNLGVVTQENENGRFQFFNSERLHHYSIDDFDRVIERDGHPFPQFDEVIYPEVTK